MRNAIRFVALLGVAVAMLSASSSAKAQWPYDYGYGGGYNWGFQRWALLNGQMPPYFAMFPPVYYKMPIEARSYGTSPFAYPAYNVEHVKPVQPAMISNPYVTPPKSTKSKSAQVRRIEPLVVLNPYVTHGPPASVASDPR